MRTLALAVLAIGCSAASPVAPARTLRISNALATAVAVGIDGTQRVGWVEAGSSATITIPDAARTLQYSLVPFSAPDGSGAPSDSLGDTVSLSAGDQQVAIDNQQSGGAVFYVDMLNATGSAIDLAIVENGRVRCLASLGDRAAQRYGYFRFTPTTELRYYHGGNGCTGVSYVFWSPAVVGTFLAHSGALTLRAVWAV